MESYSFVPKVVIQSKESASDIWKPKNAGAGVGDKFGSGWRENLTRSTRDKVKLLHESPSSKASEGSVSPSGSD